MHTRSVLGIPTSSCDNHRWVSWHACYRALQAFYRDFFPVDPTGLGGARHDFGVGRPYWWLYGPIHTKYVYGAAVWRSCRLLHFGDVALLKEIKYYPSIVRCGVILLVAVFIPEMLPGKWHSGFSQIAPVELTEVSVGEHRDMYRTTTSWDPISLALFGEALTRLSTYPKPAIYQWKLEFSPVTEDDMLPMGHCQLLPPLCPLQAETVEVGSQRVLPWGSIGTVTTGQEPVVYGFWASPHSMQIPHPRCQGPITYEAILSGHPQ